MINYFFNKIKHISSKSNTFLENLNFSFKKTDENFTKHTKDRIFKKVECFDVSEQNKNKYYGTIKIEKILLK